MTIIRFALCTAQRYKIKICRRLVASLAHRMPGLDSWPVRVKSVVHKWHLARFYFSPSTSVFSCEYRMFHSCSILIFIVLRCSKNQKAKLEWNVRTKQCFDRYRGSLMQTHFPADLSLQTVDYMVDRDVENIQNNFEVMFLQKVQQQDASWRACLVSVTKVNEPWEIGQ
jgi:hypothetical protein